MRRWSALLALTACGRSASRSVCDDYLACSAAVSAELGDEAAALYGDDGACWDFDEDGDSCAAKCEEGVVGLWYVTGEASCDPAALGLDDALTQGAFEAAFADRFCEEWVACNTAGTECPTGTGTGTPTSTCDYDAAAGAACVSGTWTCNTDFPGFEYPIPPEACADVCGG